MQRFKRETGQRFPINENCRASDLLDILWEAQELLIARLERCPIDSHISVFKDESAYRRVVRIHAVRDKMLRKCAGY